MTITAIDAAPLDVEAHRQAIAEPSGGAQVVFCGVVRDHDAQRSVSSLHYQHHPRAADELAAIVAGFAARTDVLALAVSHRVGDLAVGDVALVAAVSTVHRREAFQVCAELVDEVKKRLPIWKHQVFTDGTDEWVNCP